MLVDDEDEEVSGILDSDSLDPASLGGGHGGRRSPRALSPARVTRSPRPSSPARAASPARQGKRLRVGGIFPLLTAFLMSMIFE